MNIYIYIYRVKYFIESKQKIVALLHLYYVCIFKEYLRITLFFEL